MAYKIFSESSILVLGSSGMIGSAIVRKLETIGKKWVLKPTHKELDLLDLNSVIKFFTEKQIDIVIMAAGRVGGILENQSKPFKFISENIQMQLNVCLAANKCKVNKVVLFGSSCMYPKNTKQPMPVSAILSGSPEPTSLPYAISKLAGLHMALAYNNQFKSNRYMIVIPNSTFGPGDNFDLSTGHVLSVLINKFHIAKDTKEVNIELWGSGTPRREFIFSDDLAEAIIFLLNCDADISKAPINIGVGKDYSISELAQVIRKVVGYNGKISWDTSKPDGAPQKLLDSSLINNLGWRNRFGLEEGIQLTYDWFLSQEKGPAR